MPMLPEKQLLTYLLFRLQLVLLCSRAHLFYESVHMQIISNYPPGYNNRLHVFLAVDMALLMSKIIKKGINNSADFRGFFSPERTSLVPVSLEPSRHFLNYNFLRQLWQVQRLAASAPLPTCSQTKGVKFHWTKVNEHFHLGGKTGGREASVCCFTCTRGCVWWWHGRWCSSALGPLSSRRKCAAWDKPPCRLSGSNSHLNGPGWFCCLWVLGWWILFLGRKKKNKTRKRDNIMSQGLQVYQYSCFIFIFRLETYMQVNACTSKEKWQDDTNWITPHVPSENAWDLGKYTTSHSGRDLKVQYVVFGTKRKHFIDLSFTQLKRSKSSNTLQLWLAADLLAHSP